MRAACGDARALPGLRRGLPALRAGLQRAAYCDEVASLAALGRPRGTPRCKVVRVDADAGWSSAGGGPDGPDVVVADHRLNPDHGTGVGGHDHVAGADVHADVVDRARVGEILGPKHQVAGLEIAWVQDPGAGVPLLTGGPRELDASLLVGALHQP